MGFLTTIKKVSRNSPAPVGQTARKDTIGNSNKPRTSLFSRAVASSLNRETSAANTPRKR